MRQRFAALVIMYLRNGISFSLPSLAELRKPKVLFKTLGIGLGILAIVADLGFVFVMMNLGLYKALAPAGMQSFVLLNAATTAAVLVFVFAFLMSLSMFSSSATDAGFLSLPLPPRDLLAGRMILVYVTDAALGIFVMAVSLVVYGIKESPPLLFYLDGIVDALALPLLPIAITYLILVPAVRSSKLFRNKNFILYLGGFLGMLMALAFNFYLQSSLSRLGGAASLARITSTESLVSELGRAWIPSWLAWKSLTGAGSIVGPLCSLAGLALGLGACVLVACFLGPSYVHSLEAFGESTAKLGRIAPGRGGKIFTRRRAIFSLVMREFRLMRREPRYFLNGPFVVVLMPVILAIAYLAQGEKLKQALGSFTSIMGGPAGYLVPAAFGAFLGSATSIACTAVSRDAKLLPWIRALPVTPAAYFGAKLLQAEFYTVFGAAVGVGAGIAVLGTSPADALCGSLLAMAFSTTLNMIGLWLDTAWPRLSWDNPIAALKQNPNAVIVILGAMGLLGGMGALTFTLRLPRYGYGLLYGAVFAVAIAVWTALYPGYAARRYEKMEG